MDYGPFLSASVMSWPTAQFDNGPGSFTGDTIARGIILKLGTNWDAGLVFDTDTLRMAAGWVDGPLKLRGVIFDGGHGPSPTIGAPPLFQTPNGPGWAGPKGSFDDPRPNTIDPLPRPGPLPATWAKYKGLYRHGNNVVLSYTVNETAVLESGAIEQLGDAKALARIIRVGPSAEPMILMVADGSPEIPKSGETKRKTEAVLKSERKRAKGSAKGNRATMGDNLFAVVNAPTNARLELRAEEAVLLLHLPARKTAHTFKVLIGRSKEGEAFDQLVKRSAPPPDLEKWTQPGPALWKEEVTTRGVVGTNNSEPYVVDVLTLPYENPYHSWMRVGGFDFFKDGKSAALCTWSGDVWIVSGIDETLENLRWKRFAAGLHQTLGLKIVDDVIYTVGHDQITRFHDQNKDGEADFYENFNNDWELTTAFHAFCFDLHTDPEGNFLFAFGSPVHSGGSGFQKITRHHGSILKVSRDGRKLDIYATGFRAPNGIGVGPEGQVTSGDNQGTWVPASPLHWVKPGSFNGVVDSAHMDPKPTNRPNALMWFPQNADNSCGGQVWVTSDKWGPLKGELLHMSYGRSTLYYILKEDIDGQMQGAAWRLPLKFTSGTMRARFNPADGQLYVAGLRGWQSNAAKDGGLDRVRYTGAPLRMPTAFHVRKEGIEISFSTSLQKESATNTANYAISGWNYKWSSGYGSPQYAISDPKKQGAEPVELKSARLTENGKTVFLEMPSLRPVMNMQIRFKLKSADGEDWNGELLNTIHNLGEQTTVRVSHR